MAAHNLRMPPRRLRTTPPSLPRTPPKRPLTLTDLLAEMDLDDSEQSGDSGDSDDGADGANDEVEDEDEHNTLQDLRTPIYASLSTLRMSDKWTDMTIRCGGREYKVHRAVVCSQSQFFDLALSGPFLEARTGVVDLPEDDPVVLERFLEFLYTGTYHEELVEPTFQDEVCLMSLDEIEAELNTPPGVTVDAASEVASNHSDDSEFIPRYEAERCCCCWDCYQRNQPSQPGEEFLEGLEDAAAEEARVLMEDPVSNIDLGERLTEISYWYKDRPYNARYGAWSLANDNWSHEVRSQRDLFLPLRLYVMADKFGVPALKLLARNRFYRAAEHTWRDIDSFPELVDELYESTPPNDYVMREIVCRLVGSWAPYHPEEMERFLWVFKKHKEFASGLAAPVPPPPAMAEIENDKPAQSHESLTEEIEVDFEELRVISLYSSLTSLFKSEKFSDMTIRCGGREFKAHRAIVCPQSPFFDKAMSGAFAEARTQIVDLPEDDPDVLERFLEFLYTGNYSDKLESPSEPDQVCNMSPDEVQKDLQTAPGVAVMLTDAVDDAPSVSDEGDDAEHDADDVTDAEYDGPDRPPTPSEPEQEYSEGSAEDEDPAVLAEKGNLDQADKTWLRQRRTQCDLFLPMRLYIMADKFGVPALKLLARNRFYRAAEVAWQEAEEFPDVVDELYRTNPPNDPTLPEIVCRLVGSILAQDVVQRLRLDWVMRKHGDFAVDVMTYMIRQKTLSWD
ncbi:hypothetical protein VTJ49DRAFT_4705 [Mycothermus thermophilus]|uniref:BTB domain-containing protein n=1 Tax=Humicola insolens TaxID=85995 RepID=A0ABR3V4T7_HUMIN